MEDDDLLHERMSRISYRANMAFTIACGEWTVHRFGLVSDDPVPQQHMDAAWAALVDPWYAAWWEPADEEWLGPIRGALSLAITFTLQARADADEHSDVAENSAEASVLAEHVLTNPQPFKQWREQAVARLERLYPIAEDDPLGDVVPREALDPDFEFRPDMAERLVNAYLRQLDPSRNEFLRTPAQLLEFGFKGTPYSFDIAVDRRLRTNW